MHVWKRVIVRQVRLQKSSQRVYLYTHLVFGDFPAHLQWMMLMIWCPAASAAYWQVKKSLSFARAITDEISETEKAF